MAFRSSAGERAGYGRAWLRAGRGGAILLVDIAAGDVGLRNWRGPRGAVAAPRPPPIILAGCSVSIPAACMRPQDHPNTAGRPDCAIGARCRSLRSARRDASRRTRLGRLYQHGRGPGAHRSYLSARYPHARA